MKLYEFTVSPNCRKARLVAHEVGISLELIPVNILAGEQKKPEFLVKNPNAAVPVLEDGDLLISESNAIMCYLASQSPERTLLPSEPKERAMVDSWLFWQTSQWGSVIGGLAFEKILKKGMGLGDGPDPAAVERLEGSFRRLCGILDRRLETRDYLAGQLSVADFSIASHLGLGDLLGGLDISAFPHLSGWFDRIQARESWSASAPQT